MKKKLFILLVFIFSSNYFVEAQTLQKFRKQFETNSGIYGYVDITTKPTAVGAPYIWIQQDAVVVEGIKGENGRLTGFDLSDYGVTFPFSCSNCYFFTEGTASMVLNGVRYYADYEKGAAIHRGGAGKSNSTVHFSREVKDLHNEIRKKLDLDESPWETTGRIEEINAYGVAGADFSKITGAKRKYEKKLKEKKKYDELMNLAKNQSGQEKIETLNKAKEYAEDTSEIDSEIRKTKEEIKKQSSEESNKSNLTQESKSSKEKSEDEKSTDSESSDSKKVASNKVVEQVKSSRRPNLSSEKARAGLGMATAAAVLASEATKFGLGVRYNNSKSIESWGPEMFLMFSPTFGTSLHYGFIGERNTEYSEKDGYHAGFGFLFNFKANVHGFGIGVDALYTRFEENVKDITMFKEGSILSLGVSVNLLFMRFGYVFPLSVDYHLNSKLDSDYEHGGTFFMSGMIFF